MTNRPREMICEPTFGFIDGWRRVVRAEEEREVFALLENKLNAAAHQTGELRMTVPMLYLEAEKPEGR